MTARRPPRRFPSASSPMPLRPIPLAALAATAALAASPLHAQRWQEIGKTSIGNPVSIDPKSVARAGAVVTATVRAVFVKPVKTAKGAITSSRTVAMFDCARGTVAVKENTYFHDERANRVYQHTKVGTPGFGSPIRGSLPDVAIGYFCNK